MRHTGCSAIVVGAASVLCAGSASAAITGVNLVEVPNNVWAPTGVSPHVDPLAGAAWAARPWRTFDIALNGSAGDLVLGVTHALIAPGSATQVFNHSAGGNVRSFPLEGIFSAIGFDTYVTLGGNDTTNGAPISLNAADLTGSTHGLLSFSFYANSPTPVGANGMLRFARISMVDFGLGGGLSFLPMNIGVLTPTGLLQFHTIPAPGAALSLVGAAGCMGVRRRR